MEVKNFHPSLYALATGLLLAAAWPPLPTTFLVFTAFLPLFYLAGRMQRRWAFLGWTFLAMLTWNALATWWLWNSTGPGAISAILANSVLMCLPWLAFYNVHHRLGGRFSYWTFIACWMSFEYIHLNWELSWPWLTLGNAFANRPDWVQWYEFTGTSGGSFWILLINVVLFRQVQSFARNKKLLVRSATWFLIAGIGLPIAISILVRTYNLRLNARNSTQVPGNIVIVQPNIDPYRKFDVGTQEIQLRQLVKLSEQAIDSQTALVVWPETAINLPNGIDEDRMRENQSLLLVWDFLERHPGLKLYTGVEGYRIYSPGTQTEYSSRIPDTDIWYDKFNTAALLDSSGIVERYHKSKLVPGVETLPSFLRFMAAWFEQFGGTTGGYAKQEERTVLKDAASGLAIAPVVCYESIYGDFLTGFQRNGANLIGVITNDGWWGNTAGHKQHLAYSRLRAIETRNWVARSANTGISAFIDPFGQVLQPQPWDTAAAIKQQVSLPNRTTFYARFGDLLSKLMIVVAVALVGFSTYTRFSGKKI